ncbi:hypothetical protein EC988_008831, partial [Linderina pennispora]
ATHKEAAQTHRERHGKPRPADQPSIPPSVDRGQFSRRNMQDNSWRYADPIDVPSDAQDEQDIADFLKYMQDKSDGLAAEQSAVYFQLQSETVELPESHVWEKLVEVPWEMLSRDAAEWQDLHELLGIDEWTEMPQVEESVGMPVEAQVERRMPATLQTSKLMTVRPAAQPAVRPAFRPQPVKKPAVLPIPPKKPAADELEAFLDDLI